MTEIATESASDRHDPFPLGAVVAERYRLQRVLGRGAAAVVCAAEHQYTRRLVALKLPLAHPELRELLRARLRRETHALACVRHPAIVDIVDAGESAGMPYLAMELLEGRTLSGLIAARGRLEPDEALKLGVALAEGLHAVHSGGFVHRDVKPSNVLITRAALRQVHLCDFGIAKFPDSTVSVEHKLTQVGAILGTPEYMPMEAFLSAPDADHRMDIYSLGVTLYECLTGAVPFEGPVGQILLKLTTGKAPALSEVRRDVPQAFADVVMRCLAPEAAARFESMAEVAAVLRACATQPLDSVDLLRARPQPTAADKTREVSLAAAALPVEARRSHARAPYVAAATLHRERVGACDGRIEDLSEGGVLMVTQAHCISGEAVRLRFGLPISGRVITVNATVRWTRSTRGAPATGLEFKELPEPARTEIRRYVALMGP